jgi:phage tail sheath protein FI
MPEYLHPGVYVEEVSSGIRPIEGVSTSTAAFVGVTAKGIPNRATFVTKWEQFVRAFGAHITNSFLPYAVAQFFDNGGQRCYIVRVLNDVSAVQSTRDLPSRETGGVPANTLRIKAKGSGAWGNDISVRVEDAIENPTGAFRLIVLHEGRPVEVFENLSMDGTAANYVETEINDASQFIEVEDLNASVTLGKAQLTTTNPLADPVPFAAGGETLIIDTPENPNGTPTTINFANPTPRATVLNTLNAALAPLNVTASLNAANRLVIANNSSGFNRSLLLSGTGTAVGRPLEGLAAFAQGTGPATGGILKSVATGPFNINAGNRQVTLTVGADAFSVDLTQGPARTAAEIVNELNTEFQNPTRRRILVAREENNRVVIETANRGADQSTVTAGGTSTAVLNLRNQARTAATATGQGRSDPAFIQSDVQPFAVAENANFRIQVNNGVLGADSADIVVNFTTGPAFQNLQEVTAAELAAAINAAAAGAVVAEAVNGRVIVRQSRQGNYYRLTLTDGLHSPNIRMKFDTGARTGFAEGDAASPYIRPAFQLDAAGVNTPWPLTNGDDGTPVSNSDYIGVADKRTGLHALDAISDVNFISIPGNFNEGVISKAVGYCTTRKDCFFIADAPGKVTRDDAVTEPVQVQNFLRNRVTAKTSYAALYYPWLLVDDPVGKGKNPKRYVPPSGFVAGLYARIDNTRGVWKAPAGTEATIFGALGLEYAVSDAEQDILNPYGVNCLRQFPASGIVSWGARTMATQSDPEYRYVPVRRYTIYLEQSIYLGTQYAVFEPNDQPLWDSLKANIDDFMMGEFRKGALAGATPEQAFAVKVDADLNPPSEVNAGRVNMEVKFAPLKPAEFVIIRISQKTLRPEA